jgi:peptidoglycan/LPS O-acetylase OafA/YrhL
LFIHDFLNYGSVSTSGRITYFYITYRILKNLEDLKHDTKFLDGIRLCLALWVALGHFYKYIGGASFAQLPSLLRPFMDATPAVDGFMVITGFLMMYHYTLREEKESPTEAATFNKFYLRRFFRLFPLYSLAILASYLLFSVNTGFLYDSYQHFSGHAPHFDTTYDPGKYPDFWDVFLHLTFLHGFVPGHNVSLLGPAWSLSLEMQFYIIFPFLFLFFTRNPKYRITLTILAAVVLYVAADKLFGNWAQPGRLMDFGAPSLIIHKFLYFIIGMLLSQVLLKRVSPYYLLFILVVSFKFIPHISFLVTMLITIFMFNHELKEKVPGWLYNTIEWGKKAFSGKVGKFGADISYSLYLLHMLLLPAILHYTIALGLDKATTAIIALAIFVVLNFVLGYVLYRTLEKPFILIGKKLLDKKYPPKSSPAIPPVFPL